MVGRDRPDKNGPPRDVSRPRWSRRWAAGAYSHQGSSVRGSLVYQRGAGLLGRTSREYRSADNFERRFGKKFPRYHGRTGSFKGGSARRRTENSARNWATAYDFHPDGRTSACCWVLEEFTNAWRAPMQALCRTCDAKNSTTRGCAVPNLPFDFEETKQAGFSLRQYKQQGSYFRRARD